MNDGKKKKKNSLISNDRTRLIMTKLLSIQPIKIK